ncbi:hypothetical protein J6590_056733 [Homalodisca vitripennis]|nr:hypothetical protein J6590_056733 [Homalodisca vitripennis]
MILKERRSTHDGRTAEQTADGTYSNSLIVNPSDRNPLRDSHRDRWRYLAAVLYGRTRAPVDMPGPTADTWGPPTKRLSDTSFGLLYGTSENLEKVRVKILLQLNVEFSTFTFILVQRLESGSVTVLTPEEIQTNDDEEAQNAFSI